ncbi:MAG: alpha/beta fold hydrolase [Dermatophilaceae bacterium]
MPRLPRLSIAGDGPSAEAVVLLLHGGTAESVVPVRALDPSVLRMFPFGRSALRAGQRRIVLATLRYAVRGWNGEMESPLQDARWALDQIAERFADLPIGLIGHSMGGRVALRVADHLAGPAGGVSSVAALAPWLPPGEPISPMSHQRLLLAHGTADRITDPGQTFALAENLAAEGVDVELVKFPGGRHSMLFPAKPWHDLATSFMVRTLLAPVPGDPGAHLQR